MHTFYELKAKYPFIESMNDVRCGTLLIRASDEKILIVKEKRRQDYGVKFMPTWGIPKGRLQYQDSSLCAAAKRELQEETGIVIKLDDYLYPYIIIPNVAHSSIFVIFPAILRQMQDIHIPDDEIANVDWVSLNEFASKPGYSVSNFMWQTIGVLQTLLEQSDDADIHIRVG